MANRIRLFTFKEGLLSRAAHDLRLHVERFTLERDDDGITAKLDPTSIMVDGVMHDDQLDSAQLGLGDRAKIVETIQTTLLNTRLHPTIEFRGALSEQQANIRVSGELRLLGVRRPLSFIAIRRADRIAATITLRPSEFGIPRYKALGGAIRLADRVIVELDLDAALLSAST